mmetsp:Transcript_119368/g.333026  ORF Transcript_119368/g.333026 Transcript_119368/m.333026 type:complete len:228 (-) Transcript_119368:797-1480(-)
MPDLVRMSGGSVHVPRKATLKPRLDGFPVREGQDVALTGLSAALTKSWIHARQLPHSVTHCCKLSCSSRLASITGVAAWFCRMMKRRESKVRLTSRCCSRSACPRSGATMSALRLAKMTEALSPSRLVSLSRSRLPRNVLAVSSSMPPAPPDAPLPAAAFAASCWGFPATWRGPVSPTSQIPMRCPTWSLWSWKWLWKSCTWTPTPLLSRMCTFSACAGAGSLQESR